MSNYEELISTLKPDKASNVRDFITRNTPVISEYLSLESIQKIALIAQEVLIPEAKAVKEGLGIKFDAYLKWLGKPRKETFNPVPIVNPLDDKEWQTLVPPRAKADLGIRRTRLPDIWGFNQSAVTWIYSNFRELDYISLLGLSIWLGTHPAPDDVKQIFLRTKGKGVEIFAHLKQQSDYLKSVGGLTDKQSNLYLEMNHFSGFRNLPFDGFDPLEDATQLVSEIDETPGLIKFSLKHIEDILPLDIEIKKPEVSFEEFISQATWRTQGSSSSGRVTIKFGDSTFTIKARKNQLVDVMTPAQLVQLYEENKHHQENVTIIKNETGKVRLAVAADLWTYLRMSWYSYLLQGSYLKWVGSVLEEDLVEEARRQEQTLLALSNMWGVPFDFSGFDRQVQIMVQKAFTEHILKAVSRTYGLPFDQALLDSFNDVTLLVSEAVANANTEKGEKKVTEKVLRVKDGLLSGIRWTSLFGNMFNKCIFTGAMMLLESIGVNLDVRSLQIKGDDTLVVGHFWDMQLLINTVLGGGAKAAVGKFGILRGQGEFLRVWYDKRLYGYPARTAIGMMQRKPWSSDPWAPDAAASAIYEAANVTAIRGCPKALDYARFAIARWYNSKGIDPAVASTPTELGGRGVLPWDGKVMKLEVHQQQVPSVVRMTNWREALIEDWVPDEVKSEVAQAQADQTLISDDIRKVNKALRKGVVFGKVKRGPTVSKVSKLSIMISRSVEIMMRTRGMEAGEALQHIKDSTSITRFGTHRAIVAHWNLVSQVSKTTKERPISIFEREYSPERIDLGWVESTMKLRRGEALDWLAGSVPGWKFDFLSTKLNEAAQSLFELEVMNIRDYGYNVRPIHLVPSVGQSIVSTLLTLPWVERIYKL